ncbi:MAG: 2Fe-2S iron-sulfur cluster binding domain-containing protein [Xanthomonadales bacterium]|nr:2Fe-2S iron-sulfur cluster binding domain-containing protein [Xanthomonadales bacterium]
MTAQVRILPSGHDFVSEGNSNLLEAGLRAGLRLGYGCSNGNCGECIAKIVSGEVQKTRHHDYRIDEEKVASGHVLMCCNTAVTDVVLEAEEASDASEIPQQQITAKVKDISIVNVDVALIHLRTPRTNRLRFLAGQHVQLGGNGIPVASHPVGSCPCDDMHLHFQIPLETGNKFSDHVFSNMKNGDPVDINGPQGDFILDEDSTRSLIFVAWRTGFAPIRSLVEQAMALEVAETMHLIWVARDRQDRYLDNLCRSWSDALDDFYYLPVDAGLKMNVDDVCREIIEQLNVEPGKLAGYDCYIAGEELFTNTCKKTLISSGLPIEQLKVNQIATD